MWVRVPRPPLNETTHSPVAERRRHLSYKQGIDGSNPSRTTYSFKQHQSVWRGGCLQNILSEFESRWCLCKELQRSKQHGPSVQSGVDATLSRWISPVQIRYGSLIQERRQLADHFGLEPEMLRVRIPPFLLCTQHGMCRFPCEGRMAGSTLAGW